MRYFLLSPIIIILLCAMNSYAAIHTETVEYKQGDTVLEGYLAYDDTIKDKRPGVLVVHEWYGLGSYAKKRAEDIAKLGYIAFAVDIYGKGVRPKTSEEAKNVSGIYKSNRQLMRDRINAGLDLLKNNKLTDAKRIAAIGYCFGGTAALELARSGVDVAGVVSFHGGLDTPTPDDAKKIKARVLALHGGDDPYVTKDDVLAFENEMRKGSVDWQLVVYGGAVHRFSNPEAGNDNSTGAAYNEKADKRSWEAMKNFFNEIFKM